MSWRIDRRTFRNSFANCIGAFIVLPIIVLTISVIPGVQYFGVLALWLACVVPAMIVGRPHFGAAEFTFVPVSFIGVSLVVAFWLSIATVVSVVLSLRSDDG
jgi:hypothetical protein